MASYQLYRHTTLGLTLQESIDELIQCGHIPPHLGLQVLRKFDDTINTSLCTKVGNRLDFKAKLDTYRFCDNVWTLLMKDVRITDHRNEITTDAVNLKVVACDGKDAKY